MVATRTFGPWQRARVHLGRPDRISGDQFRLCGRVAPGARPALSRGSACRALRCDDAKRMSGFIDVEAIDLARRLRHMHQRQYGRSGEKQPTQVRQAPIGRWNDRVGDMGPRGSPHRHPRSRRGFLTLFHDRSADARRSGQVSLRPRIAAVGGAKRIRRNTPMRCRIRIGRRAAVCLFASAHRAQSLHELRVGHRRERRHGRLG